jgi:hypothetical protein
MFQRIPNAWGDKGATWLHLKAADGPTVESALRAAWGNLTASRKTARPARVTPKKP